jgi:CO/xanthine dehydrogenase FAD-binding subunit
MRDEQRLPVAGATDVYVSVNFGTLKQTQMLDIWRVNELRGVTTRGSSVVIGALTTYTELIRSAVIQKKIPMLVEAARLVGGVQIQNRGTVGGNIANGSPAGDSLPVFAASDAVIVIRSLAGERRVRFAEFYTGYRATILRSDELIVAVEVPDVKGKQWFRKVGTRAAQAISKVVVAAIRSETPRIAFGSVGPTVIRVPKTEAALSSGKSVEDACAVLAREISPIDDVRSSGDYRRKVATNLVRQFWQETA